MKKIALCVFAAMLMAGCANPGYRYVSENKPLAEQGKLPWSTYYEGVYAQYSNSQIQGKGALLGRVNNMIMTAKSFEKGEISSDQFNYIRRKLESEQQTDNETTQRAQMAAMLESMQKANQANSQPTYQIVPPVQLTPPQTINTNCTTFGNMTNCTSR